MKQSSSARRAIRAVAASPRWSKSGLAFVASCLFAAAAPQAGAGTILSVSGDPDTGLFLDADTGGATSFTLSTDFNNVSISAPITCIACTGGLFLNKTAIGASSSFADTLAAVPFSSTPAEPLFSGLDLSAGLYFLVVSITSGTGLYTGSTTPTIVSDGATRGLDFQADSLAAFAPMSDFKVVFGKGLNILVTADIPVPEPGALSLLGVGVLAMTAVARGRRSRTSSSAWAIS